MGNSRESSLVFQTQGFSLRRFFALKYICSRMQFPHCEYIQRKSVKRYSKIAARRRSDAKESNSKVFPALMKWRKFFVFDFRCPNKNLDEWKTFKVTFRFFDIRHCENLTCPRWQSTFFLSLDWWTFFAFFPPPPRSCSIIHFLIRFYRQVDLLLLLLLCPLYNYAGWSQLPRPALEKRPLLSLE